MEGISKVLDKVHFYLEQNTPAAIIDVSSGQTINDFTNLSSKGSLAFKPGDFRLISYEWGVTYAGMLLAGNATGKHKFTDYTKDRIQLILNLYPKMQVLEVNNPNATHPLQSVLHPHVLDDAGAMCVAMIKTKINGFEGDLNPMIKNYINYISHSQFRLEDGTLARNRPMRNSLWLDDLFMAVPALAYMGKYSGNTKYFDDAVKQVLQFSKRMFDTDKELFLHGWIQRMDTHPQFHWGRANGWAIMSMVELLEVLPVPYQGRNKVLQLLQKHIRGLSKYQSAKGLWHQLLDKNDSYLETSATAICTYAIARAINRGYVEAAIYGPMVCLAWNGVASKVNTQGQVEGTCVGTGMALDPAFYYHRPVSPYAAHGYGPVLLAGAEMMELIRNSHPYMNDSAIHFYSKQMDIDAPTFSEPE
ncbi:MAG: glycoside hydrolase family 105 protein [Saprospiraceae bacterium]